MLLKNKKILISGLANKYSIAAGIAKAMHREGAELAFTYQNERLLKNLKPIAEELNSSILIENDVSSDESIEKSFAKLKRVWGTFDGFVHSIGYAPADQLEGNFVDVTTREGFQIAHDISSYSFTALAKAAKPMLNDGSALLTLSYLGAVQTLPNYNVMGLAKASLEANTRFLAASMGKDNIRVNAISAGPIKTLAASGVKNFRKMLTQHSARAPLGRTVTTEEVGNAAAFLCSDYASGITGEITYVDAGFNTAAMPLVDLE
ncbi:MAG: enoyl-ACP reductase [SAR86 cluster bacterium]|uniref:Enoyl-[acyl-carrier-protein] reductase [NADH] n=1 Tax=SAR86 cluster bacterium TaxID=2030880 RepID=A0A937M295_9GAMM|nr:enoyl-ACP reductase [SAR86 cluster bacterium]MDC0873342.1 enoyl-ACP reductase [Gammaproteobacteria bacterium]|tara:strand:- start:965 stop:1750 length:786 start_codon:yes stop_codon:yes gene_type:complete